MSTLLSIQIAPARRVQINGRAILTGIFKLPVSGPLPVLDTLRTENLRVYVDLSAVVKIGAYQRAPQVEIRVSDLKVESILPESVEVTVMIAPTPTITPTPFR